MSRSSSTEVDDWNGDEVPIISVRTEQGGDPSDEILLASSAVDEIEIILLQQCNFEIVVPIPSSRIVVKSIAVYKASAFDLEYTLLPYAQKAASPQTI